MITVATNDFREKLSEYVDKIVKDETPLIVSRFGKPVVIVKPYKSADKFNIKDFYGFLKDRGNPKEDGVAFENRIRRNKKERRYAKNLRKGIVRE